MSISASGDHRRFVARHPVVAFFLLAYALSWSQWIPLLVAGQMVREGAHPTHFPGLLGPMIAALAMTISIGGRTGVRDLAGRMVRWRVGWKWFVAAVSPLAFGVLALAVQALIGRPLPPVEDFGRMGGLPGLGPFGVWLALVLANGFGEETGWRGFALPHLQRRHGPLAASLIIAVFWTLWHWPTVFILESYQQLGIAALPAMLFGLACGSIILTWLYNGSGGSVLMVALWHGCYNLVSATFAARGMFAAITTTLVMAHAVVIVGAELKHRAAHRIPPERLRPA